MVCKEQVYGNISYKSQKAKKEKETIKQPLEMQMFSTSARRLPDNFHRQHEQGNHKFIQEMH